MLEKPRLKASFSVSVIDGKTLFLMSEHQQLVFEGPIYPKLLPLLDGTRSYGEILGSAAGLGLPWLSVSAAVAHMARRGCLTDGVAPADAGAAAFWDGVEALPARREAVLAKPVALSGLGELPLEPLRQALQGAGLTLSETGSPLVVATSDYLRPELRELNRAALSAQRPWLLLKPVGSVIWIGPLLRPGVSGCWECLAHRLSHNRQVEHYLVQRTDQVAPLAPAGGWSAASLELAASLAALELARALIEGEGAALEGRLLALDVVGRELSPHVLVRRPQCPACGTPPATERSLQPIELVSRPRPPGSERSQPVQDVIERWQHHVSPVTGAVVALVSRGPQESGPTHNYVAGHYFPVTSNDLSALRVNLLARSGGKGRSDAQARASALGEALERYSGIFWGDEARRVATRAELGEDAIPIQALAQFSDSQYAGREAAKPGEHSVYHDVPPRLPEAARISWSPAWSLTRRQVRWLPTAYCWYGFRDPDLFFTRCDSNGNAAGPSFEEAILYGFLELVERDAVALWWYNRVQRPALDADGLGLPRWGELKRHYRERLGRDLFALDLTTDLGIPVVGVVSRRLDRAVEDIIVGFAAHLDPARALGRAVEEANQYLPSVQDEAPDGSTIYKLYNEETLRWWRSASYANQPWLLPHPGQAPRPAAERASQASGDARTDVETCVAAAERCGLELIVLDQSRPDLDVPVAKVVVPGLRHFWRRLAPGRLYDVPVKLGWLEQPRKEDELNPVSCFV